MRRLTLAICILLLLAGCARGGGPTPARTAAATPRGTPRVSVRQVTPRIPRPATPAPAYPQIGPREGTTLVVNAVGLLLGYADAPPPSGDLFGAAHAGAVGALRRMGYAVEADPPAFDNDPVADEARFAAAYLRLATAAGSEVDGTALAHAAIRAAADRIDECNTYLLEPEEYRQLRAGTVPRDDEYGGLGVNLRAGSIPATIAAIYPGTPAERAGLRPGDAIVAVAGRSTETLPAEEVGALLRGPAGTAIELAVMRPGEAGPRLLTLERARVAPPAFDSAILAGTAGRSVGYIRLAALEPGLVAELDRALGTFAAAGAAAIVLDLREGRGEDVTTLAAIVGRFLREDGPVAYRMRRGGEEGAIVAEARPPGISAGPLAVLINGGTTGTAEALAAALRDRADARLFGEATAGCVSLAADYPLAGGAALRIGIAQLASPARRPLAGVGLRPDETVWPNPASATDPIREAAVRWVAR
jgi:carboxyl-terminal processing protease